MNYKLIAAGIVVCACALGQEVTESPDLLATAVVGYSQFHGVGSTANYGTQKDNIQVNTSTGSSHVLLSFSTGVSNQYFSGQPDSGNQGLISVTIELDLTQLTTHNTDTWLFDAQSSPNVNDSVWGFGLTNNNKLIPYWSGDRWNTWTPSMESLGTEGTVILTFTTGNTGSAIYKDGQQIGSNANLKFSNNRIDVIALNGQFADAIQQLYVHNTQLIEQQAQQLYTAIKTLSVPEPITGTLITVGMLSSFIHRRRKRM